MPTLTSGAQRRPLCIPMSKARGITAGFGKSAKNSWLVLSESPTLTVSVMNHTQAAIFASRYGLADLGQ